MTFDSPPESWAQPKTCLWLSHALIYIVSRVEGEGKPSWKEVRKERNREDMGEGERVNEKKKQ